VICSTPHILLYFPSKKFTYIVAILLLIGAGVFAVPMVKKISLVFMEDKIQANKGDFFAEARKNVIAGTSQDTDGDGLKDWEEILLGTKKDEQDSDGDGFYDKEEVSEGYDPLSDLSNPTTGEKKKEKNTNEFSPEDWAFDPESGNLTTALARVFVFNPENGLIDNPSDAVISAVEKENDSVLFFIKRFTEKLNPKIGENVLIISEDASEEIIQKYIETFSLYPFNLPGENKENLEVFYELIQEEKKDFSVLEKYVQYFDKGVTDFKNVLVPRAFVGVHKKKIELFLAHKEIFKGLKTNEDDPLRAFLSLGRYKEAYSEVKVLENDFSKLVEKYKGQ